MRTKHFYTELCTPYTNHTDSEPLFSQPLKSLQSSQLKLSECPTPIHSSTTSLNHSQLRISTKKRTKISILPNRQKVKLQCKTRRREQYHNSSTSRFGLGWGSKKQIQNPGKAYTEFLTMLSFMNNKLKRKCFKIEVLIDDLIVYFTIKSETEWSKEVSEVVKISSMIKCKIVENENGEELKYDAIKQCQGQLSKLFFNISFEIYLYKHNLQNLNILSLIHRDIEYYSRRLGLLNLTILCCMDMGRLYLDYFEMQQAAVQYSKAVKLAVFLGDKYSEELAIDRLGMCEYYKGDIVSAHYFHNSTDKLSSYDKWKIYKYYSNQNQIQKILEAKTKEKSMEEEVKEEFFRHKENYQFNFDGMTKDSEYVQKNYQCFRNNVKEMIKVNSLRKKVPMIKRVVTRAQKIGERSYLGREYCIPRASKYHNKSNQRSRQEFLMSHRSFNRNNLTYQSQRIDKHCRIIDQILNFMTNQQRNYVRQIKEERQSYLSDENV